jgi:UDPglucose--hexose-1-phosphate uridylyltransferase
VHTIARAARPHDSPTERVAKAVLPEKCFFCPGNENLTPPEISRVESGGKWSVRVFPNKFPAFSRDCEKAYGRHEVIVETPDHSKTISELPAGHLLDYLKTLRSRMQDSAADTRLKYTCIFKNEGKDAGASLEHSHTQLVGMDFVPKHVQKVAKKASAIAALPQKQAKSVFYKNELFAALCPKGSRFQHEIWIVPVIPLHSLVSMNDAQLLYLAQALKAALAALDAATGYAPYNILYHSAPHNELDFTFHVQILPRLAHWAGFEYATEIVMSSAVPRDSAKLLSNSIGRMK